MDADAVARAVPGIPGVKTPETVRRIALFVAFCGAAWAGALTLTGRLLPTTLRFGTDAGGLSEAQLAAVRIGGDKVGITDAGYLYRIAAGTVISVR